MRGGLLAALALVAAPAAAQQAPLPPQAVRDVIPDETSIGTLHRAGYVVGPIATQPATDAAVNRFAFVMEHPDGADYPLYVCRLMVGSGEADTQQFPLIMTNLCARLD